MTWRSPGQAAAETDRHGVLRAKHVREARQALVILAVLQMVGGVFLYFDLLEGPAMELLGALLVQGFLAALMLGLWSLSRRRPRGALVTALATWCALLLATIILSPRTALYGGVIAVVLTMVLVRGARAAVFEARLARARIQQA